MGTLSHLRFGGECEIERSDYDLQQTLGNKTMGYVNVLFAQRMNHTLSLAPMLHSHLLLLPRNCFVPRFNLRLNGR